MNQVIKYPRTSHIEGSRIQKNDKKITIPLAFLHDKHIVIEEKVDGANSGISFEDYKMHLQSRGHYLTGGYREKHFDLFKAFAAEHISALWELLKEKYIMYGEWMYGLHSVYYNDLPSYFLEFDIYDKEFKYFLSTKERQRKLKDFPFIKSVPIIRDDCKFNLTLSETTALIKKSDYIKGDHFYFLKKEVEKRNLDFENVKKETDNSNLMEGLYLKWEKNGVVEGRYKYVRPSFLQTVINSNSHWLNRPIIPNQLRM